MSYTNHADVGRLRVVPLTREAAKNSGHMSWIESADPVAGLKNLLAGVVEAPFNYAAWTDAGAVIPQQTREVIKQWRAANSPPFSNKRKNSYRPEEIDGYVEELFNGAANEPVPAQKRELHVEGVRALRSHVTGFLGAVKEALNPKAFNIDVRTHGSTASIQYGIAHVDHLKYGFNFRLVQGVESPASCVIENQYSVQTGEIEIDQGDKKSLVPDFKIVDGVDVPFLQAPENAVSLMTGSAHHCKPILHTKSVVPIGHKPIPRTVVVYDLRI